MPAATAAAARVWAATAAASAAEYGDGESVATRRARTLLERAEAAARERARSGASLPAVVAATTPATVAHAHTDEEPPPHGEGAPSVAGAAPPPTGALEGGVAPAVGPSPASAAQAPNAFLRARPLVWMALGQAMDEVLKTARDKDGEED